ncbi:MAG TPA: hypothetical protein VGS79_27380, partial [Puia sp.]|nr:hypothetical protein [Puia sp.]
SYDRINFKTALGCLCAGIGLLLVLLFIEPHIEAHDQQRVTLLQLFLGFAVVATILSAIWDALFVVNLWSFAEKLEFDENMLYVTEAGGRQWTISYKDITTIRLTGRGGQGTRGRWRVYAIDYQLNDEQKKTIDVSIFTSNMPRLGEFQQAVQAANRFADINNSWSNF